MYSSLDLTHRQESKPALDLIDPGGMDGREVKSVARVLDKPSLDRRSLVGHIVIQYDVYFAVGGKLNIQRVEELAKFPRSVSRVTFAMDLSRRHIQCCKQGCGFVSFIFVRTTLDLAGSHRQQGLRSIERVNLALLVYTEDHRVHRRIQVLTTNVFCSLYRSPIVGR